MSFTLRPLSDINALISGSDYAALPYSRKYQLAGQVESAAQELDIVIPVLVANAATPLEEQFVRALVITGDSSSSDPVYGPYLIVPMYFSGTLANNQIFGRFVTPAALHITGMQIALQQPDPDADVTVVLVDSYNNIIADLNYPLISRDETYHASILASAKPYSVSALVSAMISNYVPGPDGAKGSGLTCNLIAQLN